MCSAGCRKTARSAPSRPAGDCRSCRHSPPTSRAATSASTSPTRSRARPRRRPGSTRSPPTPTRCAPPSTPQLQRAVEAGAAGRPVALRAQRRPGLVPIRRGNLAPAIRRIEAERSDRQEAGLAAGARERAAAALRRALDAGGGARKAERQEGRELARRLADGRILPLSIDNGTAQRKLALHDVVFVRVTERQEQDRGARRAAGPADRAGHGGGAGEQDRPHPRDVGRLLLSAEPAQPRHPVAAPARLGDQAAELSGGARQGPAAEYAGAWTSRSRCRRSAAGRRGDHWTPKNYDGGGGGTLTLRRALENSRNLATVRLLDGGIEKKPEASLDRLCALALEAEDLSRMRALLSVRARRAAGAADRSRGLLCGDRERGHASRAARHR